MLLFTELALEAVLAATQHWQSGLQRSGWLASAWPFMTLNLHGHTYRAAQRPPVAAAVEPGKQVQLDSELASEVQVYWHVDLNHFEFQRAVTHFEVENLNSKSRGVNLKPCRR